MAACDGLGRAIPCPDPAEAAVPRTDPLLADGQIQEERRRGGWLRGGGVFPTPPLPRRLLGWWWRRGGGGWCSLLRIGSGVVGAGGCPLHQGPSLLLSPTSANAKTMGRRRTLDAAPILSLARPMV
ncbi:Os04g0125100 [Oryza sativa Japonica Group]|uniref:Os04g0125100 protein n=2 Tax=Oryza sativa subsp. japonica TaxID=39947 RepID=Q0JF99_ORYSJ|nr:hypothetical protein DAI22_04g010700 [Oryza sativa Japonica Group]BAF13988.1 Os04g0125100 [Oryza sativa Japonica Group]BAG98390.1 unnamed protein product [Oryza sativa Japonica Group]BAS87667.1 Os04g0125100 [Oryza sativa Japonica Group]|eukprot:NP_001052074.1 Os04g0125100 [Oryza sativa Japonica Group]